MTALDWQERQELRAEYASGRWSLDELADIWDLPADEIEQIVEPKQKAAKDNGFSIERRDLLHDLVLQP